MSNWLTSSEIAKLIGVKPDTIHTYRKRNLLPPPERFFERTPAWKQETIEEWQRTRSRIEENNVE